MNSPTLALLRKDRLWLLGFALVGSLTATLVLFDRGFSAVFVIPESRFVEDLGLLLGPLAVLLALASALSEDLRSTRDFLRHRPLTARRVFWTRQLACLAVIVAWMASAVAILWLRELTVGLGGACADAGRIGALAATTAGFLLDHALVVFAFALPTRWFHRAWSAGLLVFAHYALQSLAGPEDPSWTTCLASATIGALALFWAAARCERSGFDPDRPTPGPTLAVTLAPGLVAAALFGAITASGWQELALRGLGNTRPGTGQVGPGELGLLAPPDADDLCTVLTADGARTERRVPNRSYFPAPLARAPGFDAAGVRALYPDYARYMGARNGQGFRRRVWIDGDALRIVEQSRESRSCWTLPLPGVPAERTLVHPDVSTAAVEASLVELRDRDVDSLFYVAPGLGTPWLVTDETPPRLEPRPLPDSDRARRPIWIAGDDEPEDYSRGRRGMAGVTHDWLFRADAWQRVEKDEPEVRHTVLDDDPLTPEVELRLRDGTSLRHRYGLTRAREKLLAAWAGLAAILRPTPFAFLGLRRDYAAVARAKPDEALLVLDPLLGGGYGWLLAPNLALNAGLLLLVLRDLRRRGASRRRIAGWMLATLVAGVFTGPLLLALEPMRAWRRPAKGTPPEMLVRAA